MVYITSDLFGPRSAHDREHSSPTTFWPPMTGPQHTAGLGKRKRHVGEEGSSKYEALVGATQGFKPDLLSNTYPGPDRLSSYAIFSASQTLNTTERRPIKQLKRIAPRTTLVKSTSHLMDVEFENTDVQAHTMSDLRPCHACNFAPKRKKDLVNYLDCKRCDGRTCYICARECVGGCAKAVCKKCIVEVGQEGDSWCLDCYSRNINS